MVANNKILTVSYGAFSCTLEGFEDSFGTMTAIAEYFRDLAADDRYFGAVPPVPDAEMLTRIAEREVARRVEARLDASGIVLRMGGALDAAKDPAAAGPAEPEPAMPPAARMPANTAPRRGPVPPAAAEGADDPATAIDLAMAADHEGDPLAHPAASVAAAPLPPHPDADSVAAKLQRIRAVVGRAAAVTPEMHDSAGQPAEAPLWPSAGGDGAGGDGAGLAEAATAEATAPLPAAAGTSAKPDAGAETARADAKVSPDATPMAATAAAPSPETPADSASGAEPDMRAGEPAAMPEATPAPVRPRVIRMRRADFDAAVAAGAVSATLAAARPTAPDLPAAEPLSDSAAKAQPDGAGDSIPAEPPVATRAVEAAAPDAALHGGPHMDAADAPPAQPDATGADDTPLRDDLPLFPETDDLDDLTDLSLLDSHPAQTAGALSAEDEAELLQELAAVEQGIALDGAEAGQDDAEPDANLAAMSATSPATPVTDEAVAAEDGEDATIAAVLAKARMRTLGAATSAQQSAHAAAGPMAQAMPDPATAEPAETGPATLDPARETAQHGAQHGAMPRAAADAAPDNIFASDDAAEDEAAAPQADRPGRDRLPDPAVQDEAAMSRLLTQTDAEFNAPEASRRREAIAQLKAAVAATEAARRLGEVRKLPEGGGEEAFRDDLRQVVRPRRPTAPLAPEARSERPRPAPLKLVAAQRIDLPAEAASPAAPAMPVRPRRVTVEADPTPADMAAARVSAGSFTEFAEAKGATSLADLLEAAAAYTAFVEGSEDFSRPQLLTKVREIAPEDFSREDGLRSFGTLLREGRIIRGRPGRFVVNEDTRFRPERHAG